MAELYVPDDLTGWVLSHSQIDLNPVGTYGEMNPEDGKCYPVCQVYVADTHGTHYIGQAAIDWDTRRIVRNISIDRHSLCEPGLVTRIPNPNN